MTTRGLGDKIEIAQTYVNYLSTLIGLLVIKNTFSPKRSPQGNRGRCS